MSGPDSSAGSSATGLITRRMAVERSRTGAIIQIALGFCWLLIGVVNSFRVPQDVAYWFMIIGHLVVGVGTVVVGIMGLRARARRIAVFDAEYGVDAGRQQPRS